MNAGQDTIRTENEIVIEIQDIEDKIAPSSDYHKKEQLRLALSGVWVDHENLSGSAGIDLCGNTSSQWGVDARCDTNSYPLLQEL
jgi:hypothetical protein